MRRGALQHTAALEALTDLLLAIRQSADLRVLDLQTILAGPDGQPDPTPPVPDIDQADWDEASAALPVAQAAYSQALAHLGSAELLAASNSFWLASTQSRTHLSTLDLLPATGTTNDRDGDGAPDFLEFRLGASPLHTDSDGDGLSDIFEITKGGASFYPSMADSNKDGTPDPDEDPDEEGLTNLEEQDLGTDPIRAWPLPGRTARGSSPTRKPWCPCSGRLPGTCRTPDRGCRRRRRRRCSPMYGPSNIWATSGTCFRWHWICRPPSPTSSRPSFRRLDPTETSRTRPPELPDPGTRKGPMEGGTPPSVLLLLRRSRRGLLLGNPDR